MIGPVSSPRPIELLRASSDQIRRAADLLAEIAGETDPRRPARRASTRPAPDPADEADRAAEDRTRTILEAQRSFVASLRLEQVEERLGPR
jgi:hypothetical protein